MSASRRKTSPDGLYPSPATLYHTQLRDAASYEAVRQGMMKLRVLLWLRDGGNVRKIQQAETLEELLDLTPLASGLAEYTWHDQLAEFGEAVAPAIADRLRRSGPGNLHENVVDRLVGELRWRGPAGVQALQKCFPALDDYGKSLACVVFGLLNVHQAADLIWKFYRRVRNQADEWYFIAALWGLVDLGDQRVCPALLEWLRAGESFYELFGFLALAGDETAVVPLLKLVDDVEDRDRYDLALAAAAIGQRLGRPAFLQAILTGAPEDEAVMAAEVADRLLSIPAEEVRRYFEVFLRGFQADDVQVLGKLA